MNQKPVSGHKPSCKNVTAESQMMNKGKPFFSREINFGEVEEGLDVVEMIQGSATTRGDRPVDDIEMRITVID